MPSSAIATLPYEATPTARPTPLSAGEVGAVTLPGALPPVPVTVDLASGYRRPVAFAQPPSDNDPDAEVVVRILDGSGDDESDARRQLRLLLHRRSDNTLDRPGSDERVSYFVLEAGPGQLTNGTQLEAGLLDTNATVPQGGFTQVRFAAPFAAPPVVFAQVQTNNDPSWVKTRIRGVTREGFEVAMEEQETALLGNPPHGPETLGWLAIDPVQGEWSGHPFLAAEALVDSRGRRLAWDLPEKRGDDIHLLAALASYRDTDPACVRYRDLTSAGVTVRVQEDTAYDRETEHRTESLSYLAMVGDGPLEIEPLIVTAGEVGQVSDLDHNPRPTPLSRSYAAPVVLAQPPSINGGDPCVVRLSELGDAAFTMEIQEGPHQNGLHGMETVSYLALEAGSWRLGPGGRRFEVGRLETGWTTYHGNSGQWPRVTFANPFPAPPVVIAQVQTQNTSAFVKTRLKNITEEGFEVALERGGGSTAQHGEEIVGWLAIEPAQGAWSSASQRRLPYSAGSTGLTVDHEWSPIDFGIDLGSQPRLLASLASYKGADSSELRYRALTGSDVEVKVEEDWSDDDGWHAPEAVTFLAFGGDGDVQATPHVR